MWILIALDFAEMVTGCSWIMHIRLNKNGGQRSPGLHRHNVNGEKLMDICILFIPT